MNLAIFLLSMPAIIVAAEDTVLPLFERFRTFYITRVRYIIAENQNTVPPLFELVTAGGIKAGGGCLAYTETFISLEPREDSVEVTVEQPNNHFYDEKFKGVNRFEATVPLHEFSNFFYRLDSSLEHPEPSEIYTTRALKLEISLDCGENQIDTVLYEVNLDYDINVAQNIIRDFLKTCFDYSEK